MSTVGPHGIDPILHVQFRVEHRVERRASVVRASSVREFLHRPVLERRLFIVEKDTAILDCGRPMGTSRCRYVQRRTLLDGYVGPPTRAHTLRRTSQDRQMTRQTYQYHGETPYHRVRGVSINDAHQGGKTVPKGGTAHQIVQNDHKARRSSPVCPHQ